MKKSTVKRVVIAGSRDYHNYEEAKALIDWCLSRIREEHRVIILSGGASGADALGERYARKNDFEIDRYPAQWAKFGKSAGPKGTGKWQKFVTM